MNVLIQPRPQAEARRGGDYLELLATLEQLRELGVDAKISTDPHADLSAYDLCYIFNTSEPVPALRYYFNARRQGKVVVTRSIYWTLTRLWDSQNAMQGDKSDPRADEIERVRREVYLLRQQILLHGSDMILPLSMAEGERLECDLKVPREKMRVVFNGVAKSFGAGNGERFSERFGIDDFILSVGELAPRKNQLALIRALCDDPRPIVFIGAKGEPAYIAACERAAEERTYSRVHFLGREPPEVVTDAYAAARIHALVSLYDIAPLVTLEAGLAGCPQVVTLECGMRDYFGDSVYYSDPDDIIAIRQAVDRAWQAPRAIELAERLSSEFTWERTARETKDAFEWALERGAGTPDHSEELLALTELMDQPVPLLWEMVEEQAHSARELEAWAHELNEQLKAQRGPTGRVKKWTQGK